MGLVRLVGVVVAVVILMMRFVVVEIKHRKKKGKKRFKLVPQVVKRMQTILKRGKD